MNIPIDYQCVLFDLDGTLADSLAHAKSAYFEFLSLHQIVGTQEEFNSCVGPSLLEICQRLKEKHNLKAPIEELHSQYLNLQINNYAKTIFPTAGAQELLNLLTKQNKTLGLVTSAPRSFVDAFLKAHNWTNLFNVIRCCDDVKQSKPNPDLYKSALEALSIPHNKAIAIEDSSQGVTSALRAEIYTIGISNGHDPEKLKQAGASLVVKDLHELLSHFEKLEDSQSTTNFRPSEKALQVIPIDKTWRVTIGDTGLFQDNTINNLVDGLWQKAQVKNPHLHDDTICCLTAIGNKTIQACGIPYRYYYAQRLSKDLENKLAIKPLCVSGLLMLDNKIIFGRRSMTVTQYKDYWELVPSGSISQKYFANKRLIDYKAQLIEELEEEIGFSCSATELEPFALIYDAGESTYDICCQINLKSQASKNLNLINKEYVELKSVPISELQNFLLANEHKLIPTSKAILELRAEKF